MTVRTFQAELFLPVAPPELFPFFADASNLNTITPPWLHFRIVTGQPIEMQEGALIDYRLRIRGLPWRWRTRINLWQPPHCFVDEQICGPFRHWIHEHTFTPKEGGTLVRDLVHYAAALDWMLHRLLVRPDIEKIFHFRAQALLERFGQPGVART